MERQLLAAYSSPRFYLLTSDDVTDLDGLQLLLVEDDDADAYLAERCAQRARDRFAVHIDRVCTLREAEESLARSRYDLVLLDLSLPDGEGFDSFLRIYNRWPEQSVAILTETNDEWQMLRATGYRVEAYIVKQHQPAERLAALLTRLYRTKRFFQAVPGYRSLLVEYVRRSRLGEEKPRHAVQQMCDRLQQQQARARDVTDLHTFVLQELSQDTNPVESQRLAQDARLLLIDLLGNLLDAYQVAAKPEPFPPIAPRE